MSSIRGRDTLELGGVISDVLDPFTRSINLSVVYNHREVINGTNLRPSQITNQPRVEVGGNDLSTFYTLVKFILHFLFIFFEFMLINLLRFYILRAKTTNLIRDEMNRSTIIIL